VQAEWLHAQPVDLQWQGSVSFMISTIPRWGINGQPFGYPTLVYHRTHHNHESRPDKSCDRGGGFGEFCLRLFAALGDRLADAMVKVLVEQV
jgi:hypothetical protein